MRKCNQAIKKISVQGKRDIYDLVIKRHKQDSQDAYVMYTVAKPNGKLIGIFMHHFYMDKNPIHFHNGIGTTARPTAGALINKYRNLESAFIGLVKREDELHRHIETFAGYRT